MPDSVSSSARRLVSRAGILLLVVIALAGAGSWLVGRYRSDGPAPGDRPPTDEEIRASSAAEAKLAQARKAWENSTSIAPNDAVVEASGEHVRWFQGFGVSVESVPTGATVLVNGEDVGETPLTTSVQCTPGEAVRIEVRKKGLRAVQRSTRCRGDQLVELSVALR